MSKSVGVTLLVGGLLVTTTAAYSQPGCDQPSRCQYVEVHGVGSLCDSALLGADCRPATYPEIYDNHRMRTKLVREGDECYAVTIRPQTKLYFSSRDREPESVESIDLVDCNNIKL